MERDISIYAELWTSSVLVRLSLQGANDPADCLDEIIDDGVGLQSVGRLCFDHPPIAGSHQDSPGADRSSERDVEPSIADGKRAPEIDLEFLNGAVEQTTRRLAALADPRIAGDLPVRMVRTIVIRVDVRSAPPEQVLQFRMHAVHHRFIEEPARDARLV